MNKNYYVKVLVLIIIISLVVVGAYYLVIKKEPLPQNQEQIDEASKEAGVIPGTKKSTSSKPGQTVKNDSSTTTPVDTTTYTYKNHGFTIELPKGFTPKVSQSEGGPSYVITLPIGVIVYVTDTAFWEKWNIPTYSFLRDQKIGDNIFKVYTTKDNTIYWLKKGNVGYEFNLSGYSVPSTNTSSFEDLIKTFKFVGWPVAN